MERPAAAAPRRSPALDESRPIWQSLLVFLVPLMLSNILQSLSGTLNSIYLGRLIGVHALAAISGVFPILFFLISFLVGLGSGSSVLIGQAFGANDLRRVKKIAGTSIALCVGLGIVLAIFGSVFSRELLALVGTPRTVIDEAVAYAHVMFLSLPVLFAYLVVTTFLRGVGDSRTPFIFLIVSTALSLVATPAFLLGWLGLPRLGVAAAAMASLVANGVGLIALGVYLRARNHPIAPDAELVRDLRIDLSIARQIVRIGIPTGIQFVMISLAEIAVLAFVNRYGYRATAAYGAVNQVVSYVQFPAISIGIAASIFGSQSIGARRTDRLRGIVRSAIGLNVAIGGALILTAYLFSRQLISLFVTDTKTVDIAEGLLAITLWSYVIFGTNSVLSGVMRSSGTVLWPTAISVFSIWGVEVPVAWFLSQPDHAGLKGVWIAYPVAFCAGLVLQLGYYTFVWSRRVQHITPIGTPAAKPTS